MNRKLSFFIWSIIYAIIVYHIYSEYINVVGPKVNIDLFLEQSLFRLQKFLYNTSIFFTIFLFIFKLPFTSPMFIGRCKKEVPIYLISYGLKICFIFVFYSLLLHMGIPFIFQQDILITSEIILNIARLYSFVLSMYFLYLIVYITINKQVLGLLSIYVMNFTLLTIYFSISFGLGISPTRNMELQFLTITSSMVIMFSVIFINYQFKHKDFL